MFFARIYSGVYMLHMSAAKTVNKKAELLQTVTFSFSILHTQTNMLLILLRKPAMITTNLLQRPDYFAKMVSISLSKKLAYFACQQLVAMSKVISRMCDPSGND